MLQCLRIKNLAVIEDLTWELHAGFNILTGETGAGKSILIDAFQLLLGERADKTLIREGAESCTVEASLTAWPQAERMLEEHGIEPSSDMLILKRILTAQGQNKQFINGSPTTLQVLKRLGDMLVDMHGPHDHQSLLSIDAQLAALDAFSKLSDDLKLYQQLYREQTKTKRELTDLQTTASGDWQQRLEFLQMQISEIEAAQLDPQEEEIVENEYRTATHHSRIAEIASSIQQTLSEGEENALALLAQCERLLVEWSRLDPQVTEWREYSGGAIAQLQELLREIDRRMQQTDLDSQRMRELERRIDTVQSLKRKYGATVADILEKLQHLKDEQARLSSREESISTLEKQIAVREKELIKLAKTLSQKHAKVAPKLAESISNELRELGFKKAGFHIVLTSLGNLGAFGGDQVEFQFAPNLGEGARPLRAIASSGEMARVMLAIKTVLAQQDDIPILIFDEIDANVGGETAVAVGQKLRALASSHQVLCITHLPQVAAAGHAHFRVEKRTAKGRTFATVEALENSIRVEELARMLGGQSDSARALAKTLLNQATA